MVMRFVRRTADFAAGVAVGAVAGAAIAYLSAPRSGDDLRKEGQELIDSAVHAGERARIAIRLAGQDDIEKVDRESGIGKVSGDARAHGARTQNCDTAKWSHRR